MTRYVLSSMAVLPTPHGEFGSLAFRRHDREQEHLVLVRGQPYRWADAPIPVRIHSECLTGEVFGSLRCDCRGQLEWALRYLGQRKHGLLIYLRQEGRGIGLVNKLSAYAVQDAGLDTVDANIAIGRQADERCYDDALYILGLLGVRRVALITNNPDKLQALQRAGISVEARITARASITASNRRYLQTKRQRFGHWVPSTILGDRI